MPWCWLRPTPGRRRSRSPDAPERRLTQTLVRRLLRRPDHGEVPDALLALGRAERLIDDDVRGAAGPLEVDDCDAGQLDADADLARVREPALDRLDGVERPRLGLLLALGDARELGR